MTSEQRASKRITEEVSSWPGVAAGLGRRGEFAFTVGGREIGHLHGDHSAHFGFPKEVWAALFEQKADRLPPGLSRPAGLRLAPDRERGRRRGGDRAAAAQLRARRSPATGCRRRQPHSGMPVGIVTGASRGLGLALTRALVEREWRLVVDARGADALEHAVAGLEGVVAIAGDVADSAHRRALVEAAGERIDLLVNNASLLGPSPQPALAAYSAPRARARLPGERIRAAGAAYRKRCHGSRPARPSSTSPRTRPSSRTRAGAATAPRRPPSSS